MIELWQSLRGLNASAPAPAFLNPALPDADADHENDDDAPPAWEMETITGFCCAIRYVDSKRQESERRITCHHIEEADGVRYLRALCHERARPRMFRIDRIVLAIDIRTGEIFEPGSRLFDSFDAAFERSSALTWGLPPRQRADLLAGLNALVFMANCDDDWHPAERERIEDFVTSYWLRAEVRADLPVDDIMDAVDRMAPDPEAFFISLTRCAGNPILRPMIRRALGDVIAADGRLHDVELHWGMTVDQFFAEG